MKYTYSHKVYKIESYIEYTHGYTYIKNAYSYELFEIKLYME